MKNLEIIRRVNGESFIAVIQGFLMEAPDSPLFDKTGYFWGRYHNPKKVVTCLKRDVERVKAFLDVLEGSFKVEQIIWSIEHTIVRSCYVKLSGNLRISIRLGVLAENEWFINSIELSLGGGGFTHTILKIRS